MNVFKCGRGLRNREVLPFILLGAAGLRKGPLYIHPSQKPTCFENKNGCFTSAYRGCRSNKIVSNSLLGIR